MAQGAIYDKLECMQETAFGKWGCRVIFPYWLENAVANFNE